MNIKQLPMLFIVCGLLGSANVLATTDAICDEIKAAASELNSQAPLKIDAATDYVASQVFMLDGFCYVNYTYKVNEDVFLQGMVEQDAKAGFNYDKDTAAKLLDTQIFREEYTFIMKQNLRHSMKDIISIDGVRVSARYYFEGGNVKMITVELFD